LHPVVHPLLDETNPQRTRCTLRLFQNGGARVAAIVNPRLLERGRPVGLLGFFESEDDERASGEVLRDASAWLRSQDVCAVRGPMAYATWNDYRFVVERTEAGSFRGEPEHPDYYVRLWERAGFAPCARYASHWIDMRAALDRWAPKVERARASGLSVRAASAADARSIFQLALCGFRDAYMYAPIEADEFASIYGADRAAEGLTFLAMEAGVPVGFMYGFLADLPRGRVGIAKTIAVASSARDRGAYQLLFGAMLDAFLAAGVTDAIAALFHLDGAPAQMGWARPGTLFKQYALFEQQR
jgi:hypothetical protein